MKVNYYGLITNEGKELNDTQEEFMKSLLINDKQTPLSFAYGKAIYHNIQIPASILYMTFNSIEEAFTYLDILDCEFALNPSNFTEYPMLSILSYYLGYE